MNASRVRSPSRPLLGAALLPLRARGVPLQRDLGGSSELRIRVHLAKLFGESLWGAGVWIISYGPSTISAVCIVGLRRDDLCGAESGRRKDCSPVLGRDAGGPSQMGMYLQSRYIYLYVLIARIGLTVFSSLAF